MKIAIVGTGGVAEAFAVALSQRDDVELVVVGRNEARLGAIEMVSECSTEPLTDEVVADADLYVLAVSDSAVVELAHSLRFRRGATVVHTAGSVDVEALRCDNTVGRDIRCGVVYPLQSFTAGRRVELKGVPIFVESLDDDNKNIDALANLLSDKVLSLSSQQRLQLHLGAVFASNFTNALLCATENIVKNGEQQDNNKLQLELYKPLIDETLAKAFAMKSPKEAQTGPAKRGDSATMERHIALLQEQEENNENLIDTYKTLSKLIWETSKKM